MAQRYKGRPDTFRTDLVQEEEEEEEGCRSCLEQKLVRARTREPMLITDTPAEPFKKVSLVTAGNLPTTHPDGAG